MYKLYADQKGWRYELLSCTPSEIGGFKEYVMVFQASMSTAFYTMKGERIVFREFLKQKRKGRVHTSAITIAVLLEPDEDTDVECR